jgi:hypothetical protein
MKTGTIFTHKHYLTPDYSGEHLKCKVTKVSQGVVYYRPFYGMHDDGSEWLGSPCYIPKEDFNKISVEGA